MRAGDRSEQEGARFETAEEVPVPFLDGVDREEVERSAGDEPQHMRALQGNAAQAGAVDGRAEAAQRLGHRVGVARSHDRGRGHG